MLKENGGEGSEGSTSGKKKHDENEEVTKFELWFLPNVRPSPVSYYRLESFVFFLFFLESWHVDVSASVHFPFYAVFRHTRASENEWRLGLPLKLHILSSPRSPHHLLAAGRRGRA